MKECYAELMNQIKQFGQPDYFTDAQLATAKQGLKREQVRRLEKPSSLASNLTYWWCSTSLNYLTDYYTAMDNITKQDIANYVNRYIINHPYVAGMIINADMNKQYKPSDYFKN